MLSKTVAVVVPCYRVSGQVLGVISRIGPEVSFIYVVDDKCPEHSGEIVRQHCTDGRVSILFHEYNQGVGGAVITGFRRALHDGASIIVKLDGDGQMDPALIPAFVKPIMDGKADYTKGNRFFSPANTRGMPRARLIGNIGLSFFAKLSSGYWNIFDPTNGFIAGSAPVLQTLELDKLARRYFFESDLLFRLNIVRAKVLDIPMVAIYGDEKSSLRPYHLIFDFSRRHLVNLFKRVFYNYFLRDFSIASLQLIFGLGLLFAGAAFGVYSWITNALSDVASTTGTVMLAALPIILGFQLLLAFIGYDMASTPNSAITELLETSMVESK